MAIASLLKHSLNNLGGMTGTPFKSAKQIRHRQFRGAGSTMRTGMAAAGAGLSEAMFEGYLGLQLPFAAASASQAPQGHKVSTFAGGAVPMLGSGAAWFLGGPIAALAAGVLLDPKISAGIQKGVQSFNELNGRISRLEMGGGYQDSEVAYTMRQSAAREMSTSLLNARRHLGSEAALMHS